MKDIEKNSRRKKADGRADFPKQIRRLLILLLLSLQQGLFAQAALIGYGANLVDSLGSGQMAYYAFEARAGDQISLRVCDDAPSSFDVRLDLYGPSGENLFRDWESINGFEVRLDAYLEQDGIYRIEVLYAGVQDRGTYGLSLQKVNPAPYAAILSDAVPYEGRIEILAQMNIYVFCGSAGDRVRLRMQDSGPSFDSQIELYAPDGELLVGGWDQEGTQVGFATILPESGLYTLLTADAGGTDSGIYTLTLNGAGNCPDDLVTAMLCPGDSLVLGGRVFDEDRPSGSVQHSQLVRISFYPPAIAELDPTLCSGEFLMVNGNRYDETRPAGQEILTGQGANGCDSIINVQLFFRPLPVTEYSETICLDESVVINGTVYDRDHPSGTEVIPAVRPEACDSIIYVNLRFDGDCPVAEDFAIPSGITPNDDGRNDAFRIPAMERNPLYFDDSELIIQNRWGQKVFQARPYLNDWEGENRNGAPLPAGTYFYSFRFGPDGQKLRFGEVTIIR